MSKRVGLKDNICMRCHGNFTDKEVYWVTKGGDHQVLHCFFCLEETGITEFVPYSKPRKKREKVETTEEKKIIKRKK